MIIAQLWNFSSRVKVTEYLESNKWICPSLSTILTTRAECINLLMKVSPPSEWNNLGKIIALSSFRFFSKVTSNFLKFNWHWFTIWFFRTELNRQEKCTKRQQSKSNFSTNYKAIISTVSWICTMEVKQITQLLAVFPSSTRSTLYLPGENYSSMFMKLSTNLKNWILKIASRAKRLFSTQQSPTMAKKSKSTDLERPRS